MCIHVQSMIYKNAAEFLQDRRRRSSPGYNSGEEGYFQGAKLCPPPRRCGIGAKLHLVRSAHATEVHCPKIWRVFISNAATHTNKTEEPRIVSQNKTGKMKRWKNRMSNFPASVRLKISPANITNSISPGVNVRQAFRWVCTFNVKLSLDCNRVTLVRSSIESN